MQTAKTIHAPRPNLLWLSFAVGLSIASSATEVFAQTDAALATKLFRDAKQLMTDENYVEACPKFAESQRLDPGTGTLLNLAACHEAEGKTATAWNEFHTARTEAEQAGRKDRVSFADEHIKALTPRLCRVSIDVPEVARVEGLEVELDGNPLNNTDWGTPMPIDPGKHDLQATAPGKQPWLHQVEVFGAGANDRVTVPVLEALPVNSAPPKVVATQPVSVANAQPSERSDPGEDRPTPSAVYWVGGTTLVLAAGAGVSGALYLSKRSEYEKTNNDRLASDQGRKEAEHSAKTLAVTNVVLTGGAVIGAGITAVLYFTRPTGSTPTATVSPWFTQQAAGVSASGSF